MYPEITLSAITNLARHRAVQSGPRFQDLGGWPAVLSLFSVAAFV